MKATPIQRYALRLLFGARHLSPVSYDAWLKLKAEDAESMMIPFGGRNKIIRETVLDKAVSRPAPEVEKSSSDTLSIPVGRGKTNSPEL